MRQGDPKPKSSKLIETERVYQEMLVLAKELTLPSEPIPNTILFGGNFDAIFVGLYKRKINIPNDFDEVAIKKAEELYGDKWKRFVQENSSLITQIETILAEKYQGTYSKLRNFWAKLNRYPETRHLADLFRKEAKLSEMLNYLNSKLNPLFIEASRIMPQYGIKPEDFFS